MEAFAIHQVLAARARETTHVGDADIGGGAGPVIEHLAEVGGDRGGLGNLTCAAAQRIRDRLPVPPGVPTEGEKEGHGGASKSTWVRPGQF